MAAAASTGRPRVNEFIRLMTLFHELKFFASEQGSQWDGIGSSHEISSHAKLFQETDPIPS